MSSELKREAAPEPMRIRSVLVPLDGSPFAEQALPWAVPIARAARAKLRMLVAPAGSVTPSQKNNRQLAR